MLVFVWRWLHERGTDCQRDRDTSPHRIVQWFVFSFLFFFLFSGNVKIWGRMSLGVYQQPSAISEDEVQSSDKNCESLWNLAAHSPLEKPKACRSKWGEIASDRRRDENVRADFASNIFQVFSVWTADWHLLLQNDWKLNQDWKVKYGAFGVFGTLSP